MLKVRAKLVLKEGEHVSEYYELDVPKEYLNRGMTKYIKECLLEILKGKAKVSFEVIE